MEKLQKIQSELKVPKAQFNKFGGYNYRSLEDIVEAFKPLGKAHNCTLTLSDEMVLVGDRVYVKATAKLTDNESKEFVEAYGYAREAEQKKGMDEAQITGAASSYARKYAANGLLAIDDTKDADSTNTHETTSARNGQTRQGAGTPPPAPANKLDAVLPPEPLPELDKEKQTLLADLREFFPGAKLGKLAELLGKEKKSKDDQAKLIQWYCYFAADQDVQGALNRLAVASDYNGKVIESFEKLAKASDGRIGATYAKAKDILYDRIRELKGFSNEPAA